MKLKQVILFSFLGHAMLFLIVSFSFGNDILPIAGICQSYFWGELLSANTGAYPSQRPITNPSLFNQIGRLLPRISEQTKLNSLAVLKKPALMPTYYAAKSSAISVNQLCVPLPIDRKKSAILFHPALPYNFKLYFRDRQVAHVELEYKVVSLKEGRGLLIRRKISSGNLEADLLIQRYIVRYLFMQQGDLSTGSWQTVKIDLSAKND
ncbi:MAG: hypothetical protein NC923_05940 [Candidatus Omnitrophica bacterium]|nr:hypothetical protein [Candidatus Omnitrophota bacterium]